MQQPVPDWFKQRAAVSKKTSTTTSAGGYFNSAVDYCLQQGNLSEERQFAIQTRALARDKRATSLNRWLLVVEGLYPYRHFFSFVSVSTILILHDLEKWKKFFFDKC